MAVFLLCILLVNPRVESGIVDDWSIARTAQQLAQTGHIHYNGWEAPMLGWPLYVAAVAIKIFGFSFTLVRSTVMGEALLTIFLMQRVLVRVGIPAWNAAFGALTLALCPVFFTTSVLFMTDVPGLLAVLACLYACLRATQSPVANRAALWIASAAIANAVLGTARQIAWLGLLVMVPSALWILRGRRTVVLGGALSWLAGVGFMLAALHWFNHQPYILPEHLLLPGMTVQKVTGATLRFLPRAALDIVLMTAPVSWAFLPRIGQDRRTVIILLVTAVCLVGYTHLWDPHSSKANLAPFLLLPGTATQEGSFLSFNLPILGPSPSPLPAGFRIVLTLVCFAGVLAIVNSLLPRRTEHLYRRTLLPPRDLILLLLPFCVSYALLLLPRAAFIFTLDRYLIFLLPFAVLLLLYLWEMKGNSRLGAPGIAALLLMGLYSTAVLHDVFAVYRANLTAIEEIRASGVPRTAVSGGFEYNFWTQLEITDHVYAGGIRLPDGRIFPALPQTPFGPCSQPAMQFTPAVRPLFAVAYPSDRCETLAAFAPVNFTAWLPPFHRVALIVRYSQPEAQTSPQQ